MSNVNPPVQDRTAIVTGGHGGIGLATAIMLARRGVQVVTGDLRPIDRKDLPRVGGLPIFTCETDVRSEEQIKRLVDTALQQHGRIDVLVNNAGIGLVKQIPDVTEEEWDAVLDVNFKAAFLAAKHVIPHMRAGGGGCIVNVSSNAGLLPRAHDPVYSTSKGALIAFTKSLALCHAVDKIRVNAVCPGPVCDTGMMNTDLAKAADPQATAQAFIDASPLARAFQRMITPDEVAEAICYLTSDAAAMVTGTSIAIDGGKSLGVPPR